MDSSKNSWGVGATTTLIALPILYILSIGPVIYALGATGHDFSSPLYEKLKVFYIPVGLLYEHTPLNKPLGWYYELWEYEKVYHSTVPIHTAP